MNYETATNEELNSKLLELIHGEAVNYFTLSDDETYIYDCGPIGDQFYKIELKDYCTDWNATMPLAVEHGLDVELPTEWLGNVGTITKNVQYGTDIQVDFTSEENPLRAIVICLIKVLESKQ